MWAQGLTIGVLIAAGVMTHAKRARELDEGPVRHLVSALVHLTFIAQPSVILTRVQAADHSWKDFVANEEQVKAQQKAGTTSKPNPT